MITTLYSPSSLPGARLLVKRREGREVDVSAVIATPDPPRNETHREDALDVLVPSLVANARDVLQVLRSDPSVYRIVRNEASHFLIVATLAPDVADLDQGTVVINNPGQLVPRFQRRVGVERQAK